MGWIQSNPKDAAIYLLLWDICMLLPGTTSLAICHICHEANSTTDWIALFIAQHSGKVFWTNPSLVPGSLKNILFYNIFSCIHTRIV